MDHFFVIEFGPDYQHTCGSVLNLLSSDTPDSILFIHSFEAIFVPNVRSDILSLLIGCLKKSEIEHSEAIPCDCLATCLNGSIRLFPLGYYKENLVKILGTKLQNERIRLNLDSKSCGEIVKEVSLIDNKKFETSNNASHKNENYVNSVCKHTNDLVSKNDSPNENEGQSIEKNHRELQYVFPGETLKPGRFLLKFAKKYRSRKGTCSFSENDENAIFSNETCKRLETVSCNVSQPNQMQTYLSQKSDLSLHCNLNTRIIRCHPEKKKHVTYMQPLSNPLRATDHPSLNKAQSLSSQSKEFYTIENIKKNEKKTKKLNRKLLKGLRKLTSIPFSNQEAGNPVISVKKLREKTKKLSHNVVEKIRKLTSLPLSEQPWGNPVVLAYPSRRKKNERPVDRRSQRNQPQTQLLNIQVC